MFHSHMLQKVDCGPGRNSTWVKSIEDFSRERTGEKRRENMVRDEFLSLMEQCRKIGGLPGFGEFEYLWGRRSWRWTAIRV